MFKYIYFIGIGGIGMSALARYFRAIGKNVFGYDKTQTLLTNKLSHEGIVCFFDDDVNLIPNEIKNNSDQTLVVYTPAVPATHKQLQFFKDNGFNIQKRSQVLGVISKQGVTFAVAGTHGKTTTTTMLAHILKTGGKNPFAFLGGISKNYDSNLLLGKSEKPVMVVEADEYDRSFLTLSPEMAIITSVDADHLDIYGTQEQLYESYNLFANQVQKKLIVKKNIVQYIQSKAPQLTYAIQDIDAMYHTKNIHVINGVYHYEIETPLGVIKDVKLGVGGLHNVENSVAATALACEMKINENDIRAALATFKGIKRRFDYHINTPELIYIDDYAHHPEEIKAVVGSVKKMYPGKKVTGIFQPHLFSRTRDFANEFAKSLDLLDECMLLDIYPARETPIPQVNSNMLLDRMNIKKKAVYSKDELLRNINNLNLEVLLTMGAGDIDGLVEPIKEKLLSKKS